MLEEVVRVGAVISTGLLAGAFLLGVSGLRRAVASLEGPAQIRVRQAIIPRFRALLRPMMLQAVVMTALAATIGNGRHPTAAWLCFACTTAGPILTTVFNVPVNRQVLAWDPSAPPSNWPRAIAMWNRSDAVRFCFCMAAFVSATVGK